MFGWGRQDIPPSTPSKRLPPAQRKPGAQVSKKGFDFLCRTDQAGKPLRGGPPFLVPAPAGDCVDSCSREFLRVAVGKPAVPTPRDAAQPGPPPRVSVERGARTHSSSRAHLPDLLLPLQPLVLMLQEPRERFSAEP